MLHQKVHRAILSQERQVRMAGSAVRAVASDGAVVTKAALRAAGRLGLPNRVLARTIGLSEASVSRMSAGGYTLTPGDKAFDLAVLFVRLYRSLDAIVHGDEAVARAWLTQPNDALGGVPVALMQSVPGLVHTVAYLDARRALV
jgi:hypothetical protein